MAGIALALLAHPDDAEFLCSGSLARLVQERQWRVHIASMTPGDCGSMDMAPDEISRVRRQEGAAAAAILGADYHCLEERDLVVFYNERTLEKAVRLIRMVRPQIVFTHSPADYLLDHEMTSAIARAAAAATPDPPRTPARARPAGREPCVPLPARRSRPRAPGSPLSAR